LGALGFELALGKFLRLLQRCFRDVLNPHNGNREAYRATGWADLGLIRSGSTASRPKLLEENCCLKVYAFGSQHDRLLLYASRLTPASLVRTESGELEIFAGKKYLGSGIARPVPESEIVLRYVAFAEGENISVRKTETEIFLSPISEPWLLFWYGPKSPFYRSTIPNLLWKMPPWSNS